jgi:protein O-mannosyl-transferase
MTQLDESSDVHAHHVRREIPFISASSFGVLTAATLIGLIACIAYLPTLNNGFVCDDDHYIIYNKNVKNPDGLRLFWCANKAMDYWPLSDSTFWIEWRLWGMNPIGYHATNLILHLAEAMLIWILLRKLSIPGAFLAALIFAVHPVNVESVAWISQRKNMIALLFFLLSILWYLKSLKRARLPSSFILHPSSFHLWYWLSLAAFLCAMLGKGSAAVLPVLLLGIVWWLRPTYYSPDSGDCPDLLAEKMELSPALAPSCATKMGPVLFMRREIVRTAPFFLVTMIFSSLNVWSQFHNTIAVIRNAGFLERILGAGSVIWFYLYKAILPVNLAFMYPQLRIEAGNLLWWLPLAAALVVTVVLWRYRKTWGRPFLAAWGFFCVALTPVMGFRDTLFMQISLVADHYQHIAIIGFIALASAGLSAWILHTRAWARGAAIAAASLATILLVMATWRQCMLYRDNSTVFLDTLKKNPDCWIAQYDLGVISAREGSPAKAIEYFRKALNDCPDYFAINYDMGNAYLELGMVREAEENYLQVLQRRPDHPAAHYNLAKIMEQTGRTSNAIDHYQLAIRNQPNFPEPYYNLGNIFESTGQFQQAIQCFQQALRLKPDGYDIHNNLGIALAQIGRYQEAIEQYRQSLAINSNFETHYNLGLTLARTGRYKEAIEHFQQALKFSPDYCMAYVSLMSAYAESGQSDNAITTAQIALEHARFQGQTALAVQIEIWLKSYRDKTSNPPGY